ncbi:MAG: hypothetical protein OQK52_06165 [Ignavibacteriaceae bacterium]|jgi:hypothetical protein|nr:hypothetical protein [Ignavibacteriaceae bacterium]
MFAWWIAEFFSGKSAELGRTGESGSIRNFRYGSLFLFDHLKRITAVMVIV